MKIILPKSFVDISVEPSLPLFFLAGPILGGGDWQTEMCKTIRIRTRRLDSCYIAVPCRWQEGHDLWHYVEEGKKDAFPRQAAWERHYLELASKRGCIIFWLPEESKEKPRTDGNPYGRDTYGELGSWRVHLHYDRTLRMVVGAEKGFSGLDVIRYNINEDLGRDFPIYENIETTVDAAVRKVLEPPTT